MGAGDVAYIDGGAAAAGVGASANGGLCCPGPVLASLLRRVLEPPASPRTRAQTSLLGLVVIPRTPALQAAEDALSLALVALVLGTRPAVSPAMVRDQLHVHFGIDDDLYTVHRTRPNDFIVHFSRQEDLEVVLNTLWLAAAPFSLC